MEALRIHLFGGFLMERDGTSLAPIASRAGRSLFAYLVMNRDRPLQRDLLAGSFWPDLPDGRARRRLSQALWQIQDVVSEGSASHLVSTADTLGFDTSAPYWLDVEEFDRSFDSSRISGPGSLPGRTLQAAALRTCVGLYRGDFLAGFFDDWVMVDQDHYRQRYLVALTRLIDVTKAEGAYEEALAYARRLTHHDPLSEEVHQEVMRLCFLLGRTSEAVEQFERCRSVLTEELGAEPSPPTVELYRRIVRQRRAGVHPLREGHRSMLLDSRGETPFVGREEERRSLVDHMERVLAGPGGVVLMEGEPGVGKTRLALEAADDAEWRGFEVSWGTCTFGALRPFAPLAEVLESLSPLRAEQLSEQIPSVWLGEALRLAPGLIRRVLPESVSSPLRPAEESTRMKEALVHTLGALGQITPHVVVIDDVQWADRDTLGVLTQLGQRLADSRILLLLLYRSEEARGDPEIWDALRELDRGAGLGRVMLSPLSVFELEEMVKRILGLPRMEPAVAAQFHRHSGGNVLFALETLHALRDQGLFQAGDDPEAVLQFQLAGRAFPVAPRVRLVIDSRLSLLDEDVSAVCEVIAVFGDAVDLPVLVAASDLSRSSVLDAVDELLHRGLIRDEGDGRYRVAHDQVRQVTYARIGEERRVMLHRWAAEALMETHPEDVEAIGYHYQEGAVPDRAVSFLLEAGMRAVELNAYATAHHHLERARTAATQALWSPEARYRVLGDLEDVLNVLGRRDEQQDVIEEMATLAQAVPELRGDLERRRAWLLAHTADFTGAEKSARLSVEVEQRRGDRAAVVASLVALGTCLRWSGSPLKAVPHLKAAAHAATGDKERRAEALTELASTLVEVQHFTEALTYLDEALAIYRDVDDLRGEAEIAGIQARALHEQGYRDRARTHYEQAIQLCRKVGYRHGEGVNLVNLSNLHQLLGRVADALPGYDRAAQIFAEMGNLRGEAMVLANAASARHNLLGDDDRANSEATRAMRLFAEIGDRAREAQCLEIVAGVSARQGRNDEARRLLEESLEMLAGTGYRDLEGQHLRSLALLLLERDEQGDAIRILDRADRFCEKAGLDELAVELLSIRSLALVAAGEPHQALALARRAIEGLTPGVERRYLVHHRHAVAARAAGLHDEARSAALEAHQLLDSTLDGLTREERERAIERVPQHSAIVATGIRLSPRLIQVRLPTVEAPVGRPLEEADLRAVTWTIEHPDDDQAVSPIDRRHRQILRLLSEACEKGAVPSIEQIADALAVSESTVRRDLSTLRNAGHRVVTRGMRQRVS